MNINQAFDFGAEENRVHLYVLVGFLRQALTGLSDGLDAREGVTVKMMEDVGETLGEMVLYTADLNSAGAESPPDIRDGSGPIPPSPEGAPFSRQSGTTPARIEEFEWLIQQLISISDGTFTVRITKDADGFRVRFHFTPVVVRYDTDVPFEVPEYATDLDFEADGSQYLDRAVWSQERAASKFSALRTRLNAEVPAVHPASEEFQPELESLFTTGGITFRVSRAGPTISIGVDREQESVAPIRTLVSEGIVV